MARPKIVLTKKQWEDAEGLAAIFCTGEEIAAFLRISYDTLEKRVREVYDISFTDYIKKHQGVGRASLRRMQYTTAKKGSAAMQIWLGKQYLGQSDKQEVASTGEASKLIINMPDDKKK